MRPLQPSRSVPPAAESGRTDRDWKANLVPPSRVAHSPESRVSGSSRLWKDAHDAAWEEDPTAGSARPAGAAMHQLQPTQRTGFSYRFRHWSMSHCFERHRNSYRRTGAGLAWGGEGMDTSYRGSLAAQDVATPTTERPLIKWALAIK